ncbi:MAG: hypothetical protein DME16_19105 [Candidatus Rokuibacteriota bacterium]|nr:MAG: hypothetical protein DME16_19105 [Candidatus Rokubacteria bacterium]
MTKRERVLAALSGAPVDRVPIAFWLHNFATENSAEGLAAETLRLAKTFDWDYLKPQSRAQCFAEMWGLRYAPSGDRALQYTVTRTPLADAADLAKLAPADPGTGALGEQLQALRAIRAAVGADTPIIWTIFSPAMVMPALIKGGREQALAFMRSAPAEMEHALGAVAETLARYATLCLEAGADGLFYATNMATRQQMSPAECRRFQRPYDLRRAAPRWADSPRSRISPPTRRKLSPAAPAEPSPRWRDDGSCSDPTARSIQTRPSRCSTLPARPRGRPSDESLPPPRHGVRDRAAHAHRGFAPGFARDRAAHRAHRRHQEASCRGRRSYRR